ncbi:MAG: DUF4199 domain-containing protein [Pelobium sp.]
MKKKVWKYGLIAGALVSLWMVASIAYCYSTQQFEGSIWLGYASMIIAFSMIFVGVKNYRDKELNGIISFGKAFKMGLTISLVASTLYMLVWLIDYYVFVPDFMDKFTEHSISQIQENIDGTEVKAKIEEMNSMKELYKNPLMVILFTYLEILPVGLVVSLITAFILKRKNKETVLSRN